MLEPNLSKAEIERLAILLEELGEAQQIIGKILRHGYESYNPFDKNKTSNRALLEKEMGDVKFAIKFMGSEGDVSLTGIDYYAENKIFTIEKWLHHNLVK